MLNKSLPLKAVSCIFNVEAKEKEKDEIKNDIIYGKKPQDVKPEDGEDLAHMEMLCCGNTKQIVGARVEGSFDKYLELMAKKHEVQHHPIKDGSNVLLLNSFDGADKAIRSKDNVSYVISLSSQIFTASQIQEKVIKAGSSFNVHFCHESCWRRISQQQTEDPRRFFGDTLSS